ncbi:hypothetical protein M0E87_03345 [Corynebacterium sp. CCM 9185]|uniref:Secreted protein n=1 Tax=Corynebacterium marambiense TaxID=2765364 RepID=A0ABS0VSW3_9CORY|nr:hypothetical protein [Corynebacterium marambiense]MBI8999861.1 hypothetical protein [Corynebacterium marambiense]MCK7662699.1 hypothetical protein [Corynebacterium marambiense]MCX7543710.1 hypothetical protein [Corynebacterium marambiense]
MDPLLLPMVVLLGGTLFAGYQGATDYLRPSAHPMMPTVPHLRAVLWLTGAAFFLLSLWMLVRGLVAFAVVVTICALVVCVFADQKTASR